MQVTKPGGTREQTAIADWYDHCSLARTRLATAVGNHAPSLLTCFDSWSDAVASFGECELYARALDRSVTLGVFAERRSSLAASLNKRNEAGIAALERLRESQLSQFGRELKALKIDRVQVADVLDELDRSFRENLADWEMSGSDAGKLMKAFTQTCDVLRSEGIEALSQHLDKTYGQLIEARRESDRGTHDNIPWWKWLTLAGMFGWFVAGAIVSAFVAGISPKAASIIWGISMAMVIGGFVALLLFC